MNILIPLLAVLFIGLKLTGLIAWSWLWVLAPIWAGAALAAVVFAFIVLVAAFTSHTFRR
jgi:hypothetical protein